MKKIAFASIIAMLSACSLWPQKSVSGTYQGTLPCADCEKIEAQLILNSDKTYQYNTVYFKNKEQYPFTEKGSYVWDQDKDDVLHLSNDFKFKVGENFVEFCDEKGNVLKSWYNYKLNKVSH
ncbi:copper resistance protein NlpE [Glaesserella parasuis]|nr:copper resistance protein NlpE [Glaesserella parasuis]MCT8571824.1 copper resistance protein NlpE [Glaesserella parasuis]MCT8684916.1 copper resistance protein NlpE [Glaesserella parasuis]MCT8752154.1 copper resistance protein NlpE [Glaesserella parasuis]MCT8757974.1 copper resistance protein NlpE [Glaesserella parasuis]